MRSILILLALSGGYVFADRAFLQIDVEEQTEFGVPFRTSIRYPVETCSIDLITARISPPERFTQDRKSSVDAYVYAVKNPPPPIVIPEPTKEELEAKKADLLAQIDIINQKIVEAKPVNDVPIDVGEIAVP